MIHKPTQGNSTTTETLLYFKDGAFTYLMIYSGELSSAMRTLADQRGRVAVVHTTIRDNSPSIAGTYSINQL